MNKKQKQYFRIRTIQHIDYKSRSGSKKGFIKCWKGTTRKHFITMCEVAYKLINDDWEVYSEVEFVSGGRADLVAIKDGQAYIIEILKSETDKRFNDKKDLYPEEMYLAKIRVEDFDPEKDFYIDEYRV